MSQLNRTRVNNVLKRMAEAGVEQMIVTSPISIFYLTGEMVHPGAVSYTHLERSSSSIIFLVL